MDVVAVARSLQPLVRAHADDGERNRRLSDPVRKAMATAGLFRMGAPKVYGGEEVDPRSMIRAIEAISEADGATGWTLMIGVETVGIAFAALAPEAAAAILGEHPDVVFSGSINALGRARRVDGGYVVDGRWQYASGCDGADFFWGGCQVIGADGEIERTRRGHPVSVQVIVPRAHYTVIETWQAAGLCGSGSHDVEVSNVFVPAERVTDLYGAGMRVDSPLYRMPPYSRLAFNKVGVATGIARAAIDAFAALATEKTPFTTSALLRERPQAQMAMAEAEARLRSARAFVFEAVDAVWDAARSDRPATPEERAMVRLASSHCCAEAVHAVETVYAQAGITASFPSSPLERLSRDVRVVPQHVMVAPSAIPAAGRVLLGLDPGTIVF
ncbi:MAG: putative hydroxylase [Ilumatobacteraceae bacterium]|nr:putative hydroxylase [Ilumatobacteraceae bacterium]